MQLTISKLGTQVTNCLNTVIRLHDKLQVSNNRIGKMQIVPMTSFCILLIHILSLKPIIVIWKLFIFFILFINDNFCLKFAFLWLNIKYLKYVRLKFVSLIWENEYLMYRPRSSDPPSKFQSVINQQSKICYNFF